MMRLRFARAEGEPLILLCLGAHSDDTELGCGGAILTLLEQHQGSRVVWTVFSGTAERAGEARQGAARLLAAAGKSEVSVLGFRDGFSPSEIAGIKETFEALKKHASPDVVFTHYNRDSHQDHRILSELTWNTFRNDLILQYEIPKYDPDLGNPNLLVPLERATAAAKGAVLMETFANQRDRTWFEPSTFNGLMRLQGMQCAAPSGLAEGFYAPKLCL